MASSSLAPTYDIQAGACLKQRNSSMKGTGECMHADADISSRHDNNMCELTARG
ncbi:hypothetical protein ACLOJK_031435 [Asimina triloba]